MRAPGPEPRTNVAAAAPRSSRGRTTAGIQKPGPRVGSEGTSPGREDSRDTASYLSGVDRPGAAGASSSGLKLDPSSVVVSEIPLSDTGMVPSDPAPRAFHSASAAVPPLPGAGFLPFSFMGCPSGGRYSAARCGAPLRTDHVNRLAWSVTSFTVRPRFVRRHP